jgi:hypothetical protein
MCDFEICALSECVQTSWVISSGRIRGKVDPRQPLKEKTYATSSARRSANPREC